VAAAAKAPPAHRRRSWVTGGGSPWSSYVYAQLRQQLLVLAFSSRQTVSTNPPLVFFLKKYTIGDDQVYIYSLLKRNEMKRRWMGSHSDSHRHGWITVVGWFGGELKRDRGRAWPWQSYVSLMRREASAKLQHAAAARRAHHTHDGACASAADRAVRSDTAAKASSSRTMYFLFFSSFDRAEGSLDTLSTAASF